MSDKICKRVINAGSEMAKCTGYHNHYCDYQEIDFNPDGSVNVVTCKKYLPNESEVQDDDKR